MKLTLSWLKEHLDTAASLGEITSRMMALGLEIDDVRDPSEALKPFVTARVIEASQHPDADRLQVCRVDAGDGEVQVVCGAPNAKTGMIGVFARSGTHIPGTGMDLKPTKIRGVESSGMLCSERELMISDEHEGIIELDADTPVGVSYAEFAGLDDPLIDIDITPNRQDCLGIHGIARDLAAAGLGTLKDKTPKPVAGSFKSSVGIKLDFEAETKDACPMFVGRLIKGVTNGPSPAWLQSRLKAIGLRPISALVDVTNLITHDRGRPLHVYDVAKLNGDIRARLAKTGEKFMALDGIEYTCDGAECVIADDKNVLGFGGVMGGEATGCTTETTDVFVESALFDPIRTAMTGRKHGIDSDARYRFERGVDPEFTIPGMELATATIIELCGGEASELVIAGAVPEWQKSVEFRPERVATLGGLDIDTEDAFDILKALGFEPGTSAKGVFPVAVPSWRSDIDGEADLVEEITRVKGYDQIPAVALPQEAGVAIPTLTRGQRRSRAARRRLASEGYVECVTYSFMPSGLAARFLNGGSLIELENPISSELDAMRPSILPNLLVAARRNQDRGEKPVGVFEVGPQYANTDIDGQTLVAAGVLAGSEGARHWASAARPPDAFDAKAAALAALEAAGAPIAKLQVSRAAPDWYHPGRSGALTLGPKVILAYFGEVHPQVSEELGMRGPAAGFEVFLDRIPAPRARKKTTRPALRVSDLQAVERDFAFLVSHETRAGDLVRAVAGADKAHIKRVDVFDQFEGGDLEPGTKSIAVSVLLEPMEKTFTDADIETISGKIVLAAGKSVDAILRK